MHVSVALGVYASLDFQGIQRSPYVRESSAAQESVETAPALFLCIDELHIVHFYPGVKTEVAQIAVLEHSVETAPAVGVVAYAQPLEMYAVISQPDRPVDVILNTCHGQQRPHVLQSEVLALYVHPSDWSLQPQLSAETAVHALEIVF